MKGVPAHDMGWNKMVFKVRFQAKPCCDVQSRVVLAELVQNLRETSVKMLLPHSPPTQNLRVLGTGQALLLFCTHSNNVTMNIKIQVITSCFNPFFQEMNGPLAEFGRQGEWLPVLLTCGRSGMGTVPSPAGDSPSLSEYLTRRFPCTEVFLE